MEFTQEHLHTDKEKLNPTRWVSLDGKYSIVKYRFKQDSKGNTYQCEKPYWVAYRKPTGNRVTADMPSFKECHELVDRLFGDKTNGQVHT